MKCLALILALFLALSRSARLARLDPYAEFDAQQLQEVYVGRLPEGQQMTEAEATRLESFTTWINGAGLQNQSYRPIMWEMMRAKRLEDFGWFFPLFDLRGSDYIEVMEWAIVQERPAFAEYVMNQECYDPADFQGDFHELFYDKADPSGVLDLLEWIMEKDARLAESRDDICYTAMHVILENASNEDEPMRSARRLAEMGLVVDEDLLETCRARYDDNVCGFLEWNMIPDVKEPEGQ